LAEGVGNAPTSAMPILFSRQVQPAYICLPSLNAEFGMRSEECHSPSLFRTLLIRNGCQGWTRTNTERLNRPPCYFDTTWQWSMALPAGIAPAWIRLEDECLVYFGHGSSRT
jgi:hypothetical protein